MLISDYLRQHRVHFELLLHRPASCASRRAGTLGVPGRQVAKAVLLHAGSRYLLAVLPATHRIDLRKLEQCLELRGVRLAGEAELDEVFRGCEHGAMPPFGGCFGVPTVVDASLAGSAEIVAEGNLRHLDVRLRYRDFEALEQPTRARFAVPNPPRPREGHRRWAG
jgi:Ala-tRNA(Pro) deacylase